MKVGVGVRLKASIAGQLLDWSDTVADLAPLGRPAPALVRTITVYLIFIQYFLYIFLFCI